MKKTIKKLSLFSFIIKLLLANIPFVIKFSSLKTKHLRILVLSIIIFVVSFIYTPESFSLEKPQQKNQIIENLKTDTINIKGINLTTKKLTNKELIDQISHYELLLKKQQTHQGILINLAILNFHAGNKQSFDKYIENIKEINPNSSIKIKELTN